VRSEPKKGKGKRGWDNGIRHEGSALKKQTVSGPGETPGLEGDSTGRTGKGSGERVQIGEVLPAKTSSQKIKEGISPLGPDPIGFGKLLDLTKKKNR